MQTFLPYPDFQKSAACLDNQRLGNQCYREAKTLLSGGWQNHPASKMWRGYEYALCEYAIALTIEMMRRNKWRPRTTSKWFIYFSHKKKKHKNTGMPPWLGNADFHASHRSNLLRKDPQYYGKFGWAEGPDLEYVWPI